jgi:hypothetical protein
MVANHFKLYFDIAETSNMAQAIPKWRSILKITAESHANIRKTKNSVLKESVYSNLSTFRALAVSCFSKFTNVLNYPGLPIFMWCIDIQYLWKSYFKKTQFHNRIGLDLFQDAGYLCFSGSLKRLYQPTFSQLGTTHFPVLSPSQQVMAVKFVHPLAGVRKAGISDQNSQMNPCYNFFISDFKDILQCGISYWIPSQMCNLISLYNPPSLWIPCRNKLIYRGTKTVLLSFLPAPFFGDIWPQPFHYSSIY